MKSDLWWLISRMAFGLILMGLVASTIWLGSMLPIIEELIGWIIGIALLALLATLLGAAFWPADNDEDTHGV